MQITSDQLIRARETVDSLLDQIGLSNYLFEVEPQQEQWDINIEFETEEGWERLRLTATEEFIVRGKDDAVLHQFLLEEWSEQLKNAKHK